MLIPRSKITITKYDNTLPPTAVYVEGSGEQYIIDFVTEIEIEESFESRTNTCKITFPRALNFEGKQLFHGDKPLFERGDRVLIEWGYYPNMREIFNGWIANISAKIPVEIICENDMFLLKNTVVTYPDASKVNYSYVSRKKGSQRRVKKPHVISPQVTLYELLDAILPDDILFSCIDMNLGMFRATKASIAKILDVLQDKYGLYSRFGNDRKLYVGFQSDASDTNTEEFEFERNIIDDADLEFQRAEDVSLKVVVVSIDTNDVKTEVEVGDTDGPQRTFHVYNMKLDDMRAMAELKLTESKYTGYTGSFETFGEPYVKPGDIAKLVSKKLPERNGSYIIPSVKRTFGMNGSKQRIQINHEA